MENNITPQKQKKAKVSKERRKELMKRLPIPGPGRPKLTEVEKLKRRAMKNMVQVYVDEYEKDLSEALPEIKPILIKKAKEGSIKHIREVHEVVGAHKKQGGNVIVPVQINIGEDREKYQ